MKLLIRWLINAVAIAITVVLLPGINGGISTGSTLDIDVKTLLGVALIFGLVNALVRPVLKLLSCPLVLLTLGLFIFVINAAMLLLTSAIAQSLGLNFYVDGFVSALLGSIIISIVSIVLTALFVDDEEK
ncbi:MAG TPA: phage holin family protein [Herpetosiphonaceae bacterium]|nr:phage holin family protein [Herpetosiphonaceae bacterium]